MTPLEPTSRRRVLMLARLPHRLHAFLDREQRRELGLFEVAGVTGGELDAVGGSLVRSLEDRYPIVVTHAVVESVQLPAHFLYQASKNDAPVLWYPGERGLGFRSVGVLQPQAGPEEERTMMALMCLGSGPAAYV